MKRRTEQAGYSLVEALIAIAILAGIAGALAPVTHAAIKAASRINSDARRAEAVRVGESALGELFAAMVVTRSDEDEAAFAGSRERMEFNILIDQEKGPQRISLDIRDGFLSYAPPHADASAGAKDLASVRLADEVEGFRYLGATARGGEPQWLNVWEESAPPRLVEIVYRNSTTAPRMTKSFAISNREPLHCAFDQVSRQCRD